MEKKLKFWEFGINFFQWNLKDNIWPGNINQILVFYLPPNCPLSPSYWPLMLHEMFLFQIFCVESHNYVMIHVVINRFTVEFSSFHFNNLSHLIQQNLLKS